MVPAFTEKFCYQHTFAFVIQLSASFRAAESVVRDKHGTLQYGNFFSSTTDDCYGKAPESTQAGHSPMPIKVPPTGSESQETDDPCESLLSEFAPDASPETRAALRAALRAASAGGASVELDPALDGQIELDPALSGVIEADPALVPGSDPPLAVEPTHASVTIPPVEATPAPSPAAEAPAPADDPPSSVESRGLPDRATPTISEKITAEPTLQPSHALVVQGAESPNTTNRPSLDGDAADVRATSEAVFEPPFEESEAEEPMFEDREMHDGAQTSEEEASMAESTMTAQPEDAPREAGADETITTAEADAPATDVQSPAMPAADETVDARPVADDLFEAVPRRARHFMALLEREGTLLMPQVMEHLGLVRPKGVGGAIEPIQRIARLIGVELPFAADFAPSGYKRWTWLARPLSEVPADVLDAIPPPPPQAKKPKRKPKADRARYKKAWRRALDRKKRGKGRGTNKRRPAKRAAADGAPATAPQRAPRVPAAHRDESANAARTPRRAAPTVEGRRKRFDRPMPEVFRRANRPAARPAPPRRDDAIRAEDNAGRASPTEERPSPSETRPAVPRIERTTPAVPTTASPGEAPAARRGVTTPEERLPLPRSGVFRRRTVSDSEVPVVVIRRRKR